jgi:hypothetical protein
MFDHIEIYVCDHCRHDRVRIVPRLGKVTEQSGPVVPTPQYRSGMAHRRNLLMAFEMTVTQQVEVSVAFTDKKGNPAKVDGTPEWLSDNTDVLALTPAGDGMSCVVAAVGAIGTAIVTLTADADMGSGVKPVIGTLEVSITAGEASNVVLTPGTPEEQP